MARPVGAVGKETAERIRDAAMRLFARYGYAAVPMRELPAKSVLGRLRSIITLQPSRTFWPNLCHAILRV